MEIDFQLQAPAASLLGIDPPVHFNIIVVGHQSPSGYFREEKSFASEGNRTPISVSSDSYPIYYTDASVVTHTSVVTHISVVRHTSRLL
jgi:hypothetical protein